MPTIYRPQTAVSSLCRRGERPGHCRGGILGQSGVRFSRTLVASCNTQVSPPTMARILITSGPTRQYLDPVRYLTNASSGRMGKALAEAALELGHEVTIVSGPVEVVYPAAARVVPVVSTE